MSTATAEREANQTLSYRKAPPGFTREQWQFFEQEGYLLIEDAIPPHDVRRYIDAANRIAVDSVHRIAWMEPQRCRGTLPCASCSGGESREHLRFKGTSPPANLLLPLPRHRAGSDTHVHSAA